MSIDNVDNRPDFLSKVSLTAEESNLAVQAVGAYTLTQLRQLEVNWDIESFHLAIGQDGTESKVRIEQITKSLQNTTALQEKIETRRESELEFTPKELELLGSALFRMGTSLVSQAKQAFSKKNFNSDDPKDINEKLNAIASDSKNLFKKLESVRNSNPQLSILWPDWK